jgi:hypothetical protein
MDGQPTGRIERGCAPFGQRDSQRMAHRIIADPSAITESKTDKIGLIGWRRESITIEPRQHDPVAQIPLGRKHQALLAHRRRRPDPQAPGPPRHPRQRPGNHTPALHHAGRPARINSRHHAKTQDIAGKVFRIGSGRHGQTMARDRSAYAGVYRVGWQAKCWQPGKGRLSLGMAEITGQ